MNKGQSSWDIRARERERERESPLDSEKRKVNQVTQHNFEMNVLKVFKKPVVK